MDALPRSLARRARLLTLAVACVVAASTPARAESGRAQSVDRRAHEQRVRERQEQLRARAGEPAAVAYLEGVLRFDAREGLQLGDTPIALDLRTGIFPNVGEGERLLDPRALDGKQATVFGRRTLRGVRATLIVVKDPDDGLTDLTSMLSGTRDFAPAGGDDPAAGLVLTTAPR